MIYTITKNEKRSLIEKTKKSIMSRISNYNSTIMDERVLPHNSESIKNNVVELLENNINDWGEKVSYLLDNSQERGRIFQNALKRFEN